MCSVYFKFNQLYNFYNIKKELSIFCEKHIAQKTSHRYYVPFWSYKTFVQNAFHFTQNGDNPDNVKIFHPAQQLRVQIIKSLAIPPR